MRSLRIDASDATPIWSQIEQGIRRMVASGALGTGRGVPSVRDLARELFVNPATVAKAYQRLAQAGVLVVKRGEGTYVSDNPPSLGKARRARALREAALRYASLAATIGASAGEAVEELASAWKRIGDGAGASVPKGGKR